MTFPFQFYPGLNIPINITQSYPCVVTLLMPVTYQLNEFISLRCTDDFGMRQIDKLTGLVMAVDTVLNTISLNIDTRGFDPFTFGPIFTQLPQTLPAGELGVTLNSAVRDNTPRAGYTPAP